MSAYISEINYASSNQNNFIEIVVEAGTDVSGFSIARYDDHGEVAATYGLGTKVATIAGKDVYVLNAASGLKTLNPESGVALVNNTGTVLQFVSFQENNFDATNGPAAGMQSTSIGTAPKGQSLQSDNGGSSYFTQSAPNSGSVPCYAPGTMIDTPDGPRAVEALAVGDLVMTLDHGPQPIRWIRSGDHALEEVEDDARPVLVAAGALGRNLPERDLVVSPQHRVMVGGQGQLHDRFDGECQVPAKALTGLRGVRHMKGKSRITWIHFACDRHEVVTANGCLSESLLLGPMVIGGLTPGERSELRGIFGAVPETVAALNGPPARPYPRVGAARRAIAHRSGSKVPRVSREIAKWDRDLAMERYEAERLRAAEELAPRRLRNCA